jgi:hypothetical protein
MSCDEMIELLPDYALGTLPDPQALRVRRHLRGCGSCRAEAALLDEGMAMFASAAHAVDPAPELKRRVIGALEEEWLDRGSAVRRRRWSLLRPVPALAAVLVLLVGALAWGTSSQVRANRLQRDASTYRQFLQALGGSDVRVAVLHPADEGAALEGSAILYDSDVGQSWVLVMVRAPGREGPVGVAIASPNGRVIRLHAIELDPDGDGATWLVSSANISRFGQVRLTSSTGETIATGAATEAP